MKLWRVAGVLTLIGAEALLYGYSYPFFSLALEKQGLANWLIGLNASLAGAGILIVGPVLPWLIARLGVRNLVAALFALSLASFAAILAADHLFVWFAARFVMGACFAALWTTTEIWLNGVVDDRHRGRIIGASGTLYATCQFIGPLVLGGVGVEGSLPLVVAMIPLGVAVVVALTISPAAGAAEDEENLGDTKSLKLALSVAGALIAAAFLGGIGETAMQALLPLYGLAHGLGDAAAARLVAVFSLGEAVLVAGLGWMADRYGRRFTLLTCAIGATAASALLPLAVASPFALIPVLFIAGGTISGIYTLGVILIGTDFRGSRLAVVSTGFAMAYAAGSIVGSTPVGYLIDAFGSEALPLSIAGAFFLLTVFLLIPERKTKTEARMEMQTNAEANSPTAVPVFDDLPEIRFDLSFLTAPSSDLPTMDAPALDLPEITFDLSFLAGPDPKDQPETTTGLRVARDREQQERDLEEGFRQRAVEVARRAEQRSRPGAFRPLEPYPIG